MTESPIEQVKKFVFTDDRNNTEKLDIYIPELLQASYSFYTWPCAPVLAWFLWENRSELHGKRVLELGSGTALPGILAAKCGSHVTFTESATLPKSLAHTKRSCQLNQLVVDEQVRVLGLTWGLFLSNLDCIGPVDIILGSDCFFDPAIFEDILVTVAYILNQNSGAKFFCTYQERSTDWTIEHLLNKWKLRAKVHDLSNLGAHSGVEGKFHKLYVSNLPWTVSHSELRQYFSKFGPVNLATVVFDKSTGLSKKYGFVSFGNRQGFDDAQSVTEHKLEGSFLKVAQANQDNISA